MCLCPQAEGARGLAKGLAANATLSKLSLAWNGLEEGTCALGDMLSANMGLKHLDLSHCRCEGECTCSKEPFVRSHCAHRGALYWECCAMVVVASESM